MVDERAGHRATTDDLIDVPHLVSAYYTNAPDVGDVGQRVAFGTSGHRGSSLDSSFNEAHIAAITQAICEYRKGQSIDGPLFLGRDTHALSEPAWATALEVLAANAVDVLIDLDRRYTPTPALSHAILGHNRTAWSGRGQGQADGIVVTPSHNPPKDGGFKYNPPHGGPADTDITGWVANRANELLADGNSSVRRIPLSKALAADTTATYDYCNTYVDDLPSVLDLDAIRASGVRIGADPLGGASVDYWARIADRHDLDLTVVNPEVDPTWRFMTL
ncbi:MAG: phosphoglucomutase, partial [Acidimicrobiia bacterium]|nr:phosphoglucomutase [Acidimicrobiia bacterium]